jgi:hypothetical protein
MTYKKDNQIELNFEKPKFIGNPDESLDWGNISKGLKTKQQQYDQGIRGGVDVKSKIEGLKSLFKK